VRVRLLTDFIILKAGVPLAPKYELCYDEFWEGVEAYGIMASPCKSTKWHYWSGWWELPLTNADYRLVHIPKIIGMHKEQTVEFRNG
jgi:hypothetical protein